MCEIREDANDTRGISKQDRKLYGDLAKELAGGAKSKPEKPKMTKQELEVFNARLAEEAEVRAAVADVLGRAQTATAAVQALCSGNPTGAAVHLAELSEAITAMAPSPLMADRMPDLIASLTRCCRPAVPADVAAALVLVHAGAEGRERETAGMVCKAVAGIHAQVLEQGLLASGSFALVFPVLRHALTARGVSAEAVDMAMEVVSMHTRTSGVPLEPVIAVMMLVMAKNAKARKTAHDCVLRLASALPPAAVGELLEGGLSPLAIVRTVGLEGLARVPGLPGDTPHVYLHSTLLLLAHDSEEDVADKAKELLASCALSLDALPWEQLVDCLAHDLPTVRKAAALALGSYVAADPQGTAQEVVGTLKAVYTQNKGFEGNALARSGVAVALGALAEHVTKREIIVLFPFLVSDKEQGLSDPDEEVRAQMTAAGMRMLEVHGQSSMELLHPMLQNQLNKPDSGTSQHVSVFAFAWIDVVHVHIEHACTHVMHERPCVWSRQHVHAYKAPGRRTSSAREPSSCWQRWPNSCQRATRK